MQVIDLTKEISEMTEILNIISEKNNEDITEADIQVLFKLVPKLKLYKKVQGSKSMKIKRNLKL